MKKLALYKCFNPVAPTRGATGNNGANGLPAQLFQSTHPHGVRLTTIKLSRVVDVSIHAPTRGATGVLDFAADLAKCFNPRTHTGCDVHFVVAKFIIRVSIHAPTRGATDIHPPSIFSGVFQSTHPHGVRLLSSCRATRAIRCFNPRTHTGCDLRQVIELDLWIVSIHAPTRGATSRLRN